MQSRDAGLALPGVPHGGCGTGGRQAVPLRRKALRTLGVQLISCKAFLPVGKSGAKPQKFPLLMGIGSMSPLVMEGLLLGCGWLDRVRVKTRSEARCRVPGVRTQKSEARSRGSGPRTGNWGKSQTTGSPLATMHYPLPLEGSSLHQLWWLTNLLMIVRKGG